MVGKEALPTSMERGGSPFHIRSSKTTFCPTWSRTKTENCVDRRRKRTNPLVLIGTIEERKRMVAPSVQGTSSENNVWDRVRTFRWLRPFSVGSSIFIFCFQDLYLWTRETPKYIHLKKEMNRKGGATWRKRSTIPCNLSKARSEKLDFEKEGHYIRK
jgi:hypothetical protein